MKTPLLLCLVSTLTLLTGASTVAAAEPAAEAGGSAAPLEITADNSLEWDQAAKTYSASGHAKAQQGEFSVSADKLVAEYAGQDGSTSDLIRVTASGNVVIASATEKATGDTAVYEIADGRIDLTSESARPRVERATDSVESDKIVVFLTPEKKLDRAEALGHVEIVTEGEQKATSDKGIYTPANETVELIGHVRLMQGPSWLEGETARMNLATKVSTLTGQKGGKTPVQVKGVFYPSQMKQAKGK